MAATSPSAEHQVPSCIAGRTIYVQKLFIDFSTKFSVEPASSRLDQSKAGWKLAPQSYKSKS
jgi:hypothetical protein